MMSELGCADGCGREKGGYRIARTAADGVGAREWMEMGGEKKPLVMSELGCADGCGRQMGQNCADGCGRRGCEGVAGNGWGEEAAGDQRRNSPHPFPVRSRPRSQARSSPAASGAPISSHSLAPTPSAAVRAILPTHLPSAAVRAAKLAHPQRLLLPNHFQPLPCTSCTRAVRSRPRNSPHLFAVRSRARSHARLRTAWVQGSGWKWVGRRTRCSPRTRMLTRMLMDMQSLRTSQNNFLQ